jgi:hypothetical protein
LKFLVEGDYRDYIPRYIVFHASNLPTIAMVVERFRYSGQLTVTPHGDVNWIEFIQKNENLKNWVEKSNLIYFLIGRESGIGFVSIESIKSGIIRWILDENKETRDIYQKKLNEKIEELKRGGMDEDSARERAMEEITKEIVNNVGKYAWDYFRNITRLRFAEGAITHEDVAYLIVARYLYETKNNPKEPLWNLFFKDKTWESLENEFGVQFLDKNGEIRLPPQIVALVSARYILGHFSEKNKEEFIMEQKRLFSKFLSDENLKKIEETFLKKTPFEKIEEINKKIAERNKNRKFTIVFENPEITRAGEEGLQRLIHLVDIYRMVRAAKELSRNVYLGIVFDQEHYLHNNLDPLNEIKSLQTELNSSEEKDVGKYILVFHVGAPKPYHPAHQPIDIGSEAQFWIYKYSFELRKLGFGKNSNEGIFIFESGGARGGQYPAQFIGQSAAALRIIVEYLEKGIEPEKLPPEFYGISSREILSEDRQLAIIKEHFLDPLKGLIQVPEEEYTFLGSKAIEKGKRPEEWKKEELR